MPAGVVLAGGRSSRMGTPKAWLDWHGTTLLRRTCGIVARGTGGPIVVVRAPGQALPELPRAVRVVEDAHEGRGPMQGILAGLAAVREEEIAFVAATDMPFLHPRFVAAVCAAADDGVDAAVPHIDGFRQPLAAAYRTSLVPTVEDMIGEGLTKIGMLFERCETRWLTELPHADSVRNLNEIEDYRAALDEPEPGVRVRCFGPLRRPSAEVRAATLGGAAAAVGVLLDAHVVAAINGDQIARDPTEALAEGDDVAFMAADAGG